jgi:uncharacterized protein (DUF3820 family)
MSYLSKALSVLTPCENKAYIAYVPVPSPESKDGKCAEHAYDQQANVNSKEKYADATKATEAPEVNNTHLVAETSVAPSVAADDGWDYWPDLYGSDREYLLGPRNVPVPCPWCGGRTRHSAECDELTDAWVYRMEWGKHEGKRIDELPAGYLCWMRKETAKGKSFPSEIMDFVERSAK